MTEYSLYVISFLSNKKDFYLSFYSKKELNCYKAEIDFDNRVVETDYGFVAQVNIKFEKFHELVERYWG